MQTTRVRSLTLVAAVACAGMIGLSQQAAAQVSQTANVTAEVQTPISIDKNNDLDFGEVFPGVNKTIAATATEAAEFAIQGEASTPVNVTFTIPTNLLDGSNTLPIANWTGLTNTTQSQVGGSSFTPSASAHQVTLHTNGQLYVYVGATVQPPANQAAGSYSAVLTITVEYF